MRQAVVVQTRNRLPFLAGKRLNPSDPLQPIIPPAAEYRLGTIYRRAKCSVQHRRVVPAHRFLPAE
jgi:hypothetical protein